MSGTWGSVSHRVHILAVGLAIVSTPYDRREFSWLPEALETVALRLARADECAFKMGVLTAKWSADGPLDLVQVRRGGHYQTRVRSMRPIPPEASLLFSEAINHLRAAVDNVVWYLVNQKHADLSSYAETLVSMPILDKPEKMESWTKKRVSNKILAFGGDTDLGQRLRKLQPYADLDSAVPSMGEWIATMTNQQIERAHPLSLLQAYSNADKHRAIRIALPRMFSTTDLAPLADQDLAHREIQAGDSLGPPSPWGTPSHVDTHSAAMVRRSSPFIAWVNPVKEINAIRRHLGQVVIPILLTGLEISKAFPPHIDFDDTGKTDYERIVAGTWDDADARMQANLRELLELAVNREPQVATVIDGDLNPDLYPFT